MKRSLILFFIAVVLCGCTATVPQPTVASTSAPTTAPTVPTGAPVTSTPTTVPPQTQAPTTVPTAPPDPIGVLLESMTLEERVGQIFLARCPDVNAVGDIETYHLGGFVLFARDFQDETPDSLRQTVVAYQAASKIPMLLAVDEEGGTVTRISRYEAFRQERFQSPRDLYDLGSMDLVLETEEEKCLLLSSLGLNVNLGPVCDITTDPAAFMYKRSLGQSPEVTGLFVQGMVDVMGRYGIGSALKHFPGYGNNTDTHVGIARDDRPLEALEAVDLVPFQYGIEAGCGAIIVSHVYINAIDSELPATLSPAVHRYLRENMGFEGVIITDDLVMQAISDTYGAGEAAVLAVLAGNDLLCVTEYAVQYEAVLNAVQSGRIRKEMLNAAVRNVLEWKQEIGLL